MVQTVLVLLARNAKSVARRRKPAGWLFLAVRNAAANARRMEHRRQRHEQQAAMSAPATQSPPTSDDLSPLLDAAIARLGKAEREAVLLRFFRGLTHREVGVALGVSEDAAKIRTLRGLEKLRSAFAAKGITVPTIALPALLERFSKAPNADAGSLANRVLSQARSPRPALPILKLAVALSIVGIASVTVVMMMRQRASSSRTVVRAPAPATPQLLEEGEVLKHFPHTQSQSVVYGLDRQRQIPTTQAIASGTTSFTTMVNDMTGLRGYDLDVPDDVLTISMGGDWLVDQGAPAGVRLTTLLQILRSERVTDLSAEKRKIPREVIIVSGTLEPDANQGLNIVLNPNGLALPDSNAPLKGILGAIAEAVDDPIIFNTTDKLLARFLCSLQCGSSKDAKIRARARLGPVLAKIERRTSLRLERKTMAYDTWFIRHAG